MMNDKVMVALAATLAGAGGVIAGVMIRQPEVNKLQKQVKVLQSDIFALKNVVEEQNGEIAQLMLQYKALSVFQISKRREMRQSIQDQLVCQYAARDYLTLMFECATSDRKMTKDEIVFFKTYGRIIADNVIDDSEVEQLCPLVYAVHGSEIDALQECDAMPVLDMIQSYEFEKPKRKLPFGRKKAEEQ